MPRGEESRPANRSPLVAVLVISLFVGLLGFYRVTQSPQFESYRNIDVVQLLVTGTCIGTTLTGFFVWLLRRRV